MSHIYFRHAKRFPPFVYSKNANGCLIHRVVDVKFYYRSGGQYSHTVIECACNHSFYGTNSQTCVLPNPEATRCIRCEQGGSKGVFKKYGDTAARREAHKKLGCIPLVQS